MEQLEETKGPLEDACKLGGRETYWTKKYIHLYK
jgi:hypothetical protein